MCSFTGNKNIEKISIKDVYEAERKIKHMGGEQLGKGNHKLEKNEKFTNYSLLYIRCRLYNTGSSAKEGQIRQ